MTNPNEESVYGLALFMRISLNQAVLLWVLREGGELIGPGYIFQAFGSKKCKIWEGEPDSEGLKSSEWIYRSKGEPKDQISFVGNETGRSMVRRGWVVKSEDGSYRLTEQGLIAAGKVDRILDSN